ncbi:MAG: hypothetical protein WCQ69_08635 [Bacteroidales bacterium]|jgi:hypothetical protein|nr:hypothetical protein [Bacteroidales bacterium]MDD2264542.1 hypothetical protein [Bacteroidales bacterium]MDD2831777.1 hypothetical protein [Bacteroidales bacterium]MDD3209421.1 hypothetical protein [Bacteroidales bacterium]MDD3697773.1 hypothetical protein [Bacteroidales bacterium]
MKKGIYPMLIVVGITIALLVVAFTRDNNSTDSAKFANKTVSAEHIQELAIGQKNV